MKIAIDSRGLDFERFLAISKTLEAEGFTISGTSDAADDDRIWLFELCHSSVSVERAYALFSIKYYNLASTIRIYNENSD